jgi:hypothetical protein
MHDEFATGVAGVTSDDAALLWLQCGPIFALPDHDFGYNRGGAGCWGGGSCVRLAAEFGKSPLRVEE